MEARSLSLPRGSIQERHNQAQACFDAHNYQEAAYHYKQAAKNCKQCKATGQTCTCKDLIEAIEKGELDAVLRSKCTCGAKADERCRHDLHHKALDGLIRCAIKTKDFEAAKRRACRAIALNPRTALFYARLGDSVRGNGVSGLEFSKKLYEQGISMVRGKTANSQDVEGLQKRLQYVNERWTRHITWEAKRSDPLVKLPAELVTMILEYLPMSDLTFCRQVSTAWKGFLSAGTVAATAWKVQNYNARRRVSKVQLGRYLAKYAGGKATSIQIENSPIFGLDVVKMKQILICSPRLKQFISRGAQLPDWNNGKDYPSKVAHLPHLKRLEINQGLFHASLLGNSTETLEHLHLSSIKVASNCVWPRLSQLKVLVLVGAGTQHDVNLDRLVHQTPNLREAWFDYIRFRITDRVEENLKRDACIWPNLEKLHIGPTIADPFLVPPISDKITDLTLARDMYWRFGTVREANAVPLGQDIELPPWLGMPFEGPAFAPLAASFVNTLEFPTLDRLRRLSIKGKHPVAPVVLGTLLSRNALDKTLKALELHPFPFSMFPICEKDRKRDYSTLRSEAVEHFSISGLLAQVGDAIQDADAEMLRIVEQFPNLQSLDIGQERLASATLGKIIDGGVKAIYHKQGLQLSDLAEWARERHAGVAIVHGPWPFCTPFYQNVNSTDAVSLDNQVRRTGQHGDWVKRSLDPFYFPVKMEGSPSVAET